MSLKSGRVEGGNESTEHTSRNSSNNDNFTTVHKFDIGWMERNIYATHPSSAAGKLLPQSPAVSSVHKTFPPLLQILCFAFNGLVWSGLSGLYLTGYEANGVSCLMPCLPPAGITAIHNLVSIFSRENLSLCSDVNSAAKHDKADLKNIPVLEWQANLRARKQRVFCRVVTK